MTATPDLARQPGAPAGRPPAFAGLARAAWRLQRGPLLGLAALAVGMAAFAVYRGLELRSVMAAIRRAHCVTPVTRSCLALFEREGSWDNGLGPRWLLIFPAVAAVFVAAPWLARCYETGTLRFAFTQGTRRTRWAIAQLGVVAATGALATLGAALVGRWWLDIFASTGIQVPRWDATVFNITPVMLPCWTLLGVAAGTLAAVAVRRMLPAMAVTAVAAAAAAVAVDRWLPQALLTVGSQAVRASGPVSVFCAPRCTIASPAGQSYGSGIIVSGWLSRGGHALSSASSARVAARIPQRFFNAASPVGLNHWLAARHYAYFFGVQPGSRYWLCQGAEATLLLAAAAGLAALALWLLRRRSC